MHAGQVVAARFHIEGVAGAGAMGTVYWAIDETTGGPVAVKVLHTTDARLAERFVREADILQRLDHPHIVRWVATGLTEAGQRFLAMEWLLGEDLGVRLKREGLEVHHAISLARKVASGLGAAHELGIVHRDIKPGNLFLVGGDPTDPRILDFGVARLTDRDQRMTATGAALGTPAYMSPEQAGGGQQPDARADVFSLGAVLYECIAGQMAFGGDTLVDVLTKILFGDTPRLAKGLENNKSITLTSGRSRESDLWSASWRPTEQANGPKK
ncbi:MAG: serine/threonine protein kinase [Deltaproteobacteria bacterium]|nr:serine/threonine protein kinase [Deltaproteobacteria bacterium]